MSEVDPRAHLDLPVAAHRGHLPEVLVGDAGRNAPELMPVERVEHFAAQLEPRFLRQRVALLQGQVFVDGAEAPYLRIAEGARAQRQRSRVANFDLSRYVLTGDDVEESSKRVRS